MKEELDMLFLLEHFSLEDLVKAKKNVQKRVRLLEDMNVKDGLLFNMMAPL